MAFIDAVVSGFYTKLATYHATYKAYNIIAPQDASLPYVTFGLETDRPIGVFGHLDEMEDLTFWVNCFSSTGQKNCREIVDLVLAVMDDVTLTVAGYISMKCIREFVGTPLYDIETKVFQIPMRYRVLIDRD